MAQQRVVWFAIVMSTVIYMVLAYMLAPETRGAFEESAANWPVPIFYGAALVVFLFAWFAGRALVRGRDAKTQMVVLLAIFEACAVMGFVGAFIARDWRIYLAPWLLALIGFVREMPRESSRTAP